MRRRFFNRLLLSVLLAALSLTASAASSAASVTIGQLAPGATTACDEGYDWAGAYQVPANGTITSWSHLAAAGAGQRMTLKVWRFAGASPMTGTHVVAVGHDGPRTLTEGTVNTFSTSIPVEGGDELGLHTDTGGVGCLFATPGSIVLRAFGNAADGGEAFFPLQGGCCWVPGTLVSDSSLNISAVLGPPLAGVEATKCKELRKKLKRQHNKLAKAGAEAKRAMIQANTEDTKKRLQKLAC